MPTVRQDHLSPWLTTRDSHAALNKTSGVLGGRAVLRIEFGVLLLVPNFLYKSRGKKKYRNTQKTSPSFVFLHNSHYEFKIQVHCCGNLYITFLHHSKTTQKLTFSSARTQKKSHRSTFLHTEKLENKF